MDFLFKQVATDNPTGFAIVMGIALLCGIIISVVYRLGTDRPSKYMMITAIIMPAVVQTVIMLVNGSVGAGVAVAGAFSLVRFRSIAGNAREITFVFYAMAAGLACGMGYVVFAAIFVILLGFVSLILSKTPLFELSATSKQLKITIPEDLNYSGIFDDIFEKYLKYAKLERVRTTNLGSMFELTYNIKLKSPSDEKQMIDEIRCRNGNLMILCQTLQNPTEL